MKIVLFITSFFFILTGCNNVADNDHTKETMKPNPISGIVAGEIESSLLKINDHLNFVIKNQTESEQTITFPSSKLYEYEIRDQNDKIIETNEGKVYTQALRDIHLKQGEEYILGVIKTNRLAPGTYRVNVWSNPINHKSFNRSKTINIPQ
jgi:hypothetical protein